jgi:hypothetical protein
MDNNIDKLFENLSIKDYKKSSKNDRYKDEYELHAECTDMCPADEAKMRISSKMVHYLEKKVVK